MISSIQPISSDLSDMTSYMYETLMIKHHILLVLLLYFPGCSCFIALDTPLSLLDQKKLVSQSPDLCCLLYMHPQSFHRTHPVPIINTTLHPGNSYLPRSSDLHFGLYVSTQHLTQTLKWSSDFTCDVPYTPTSNSPMAEKGTTCHYNYL